MVGEADFSRLLGRGGKWGLAWPIAFTTGASYDNSMDFPLLSWGRGEELTSYACLVLPSPGPAWPWPPLVVTFVT